MEERNTLLNMVVLGVEQASQMYYRLLIVSVDEFQDGRLLAGDLGILHLDLGEKLSEKLLEIPSRRRPLEVAGLLEGLVRNVARDEVLLDHIEILFEVSLKVEPLVLLKDVSRRRLVVVVWRGGIEAGNLVYSVPGHPEYRRYPARDVTLVRFPE